MKISLTPSHLIQYLYCPRHIWFEEVLHLPQYEEKEHKVQLGREVHTKKLEQNKSYLRQSIGATAKALDQPLAHTLTDPATGLELELRGLVDEVLTLADGTYAPLDYKFARYDDKKQVFQTYKTQLLCYAWLIQGCYPGAQVTRGYIVYTRSKNYLKEVPVTEKGLQLVPKTALAIAQVVQNNAYPPATKVKPRCKTCTYRNVCTL